MDYGEDQKKMGHPGYERLTIKDIVREAALNLRATTRAISGAFVIEIRNYTEKSLTRITMSRSKVVKGGTNLDIERFKIVQGQMEPISRNDDPALHVRDIEHLHITWETPEAISFVFAGDGRFNLVNVNRTGKMQIINGIDKREDEPETLDGAGSKLRRKFYHIGASFQQ